MWPSHTWRYADSKGVDHNVVVDTEIRTHGPAASVRVDVEVANTQASRCESLWPTTTLTNVAQWTHVKYDPVVAPRAVALRGRWGHDGIHTIHSMASMAAAIDWA